jgi:inner membrane transporter RhtA
MTERVPAWSLAVVSMLSVQLGAALSVSLFPIVGPAGTACLRLSAGALIFVLVRRPTLRGYSASERLSVVALGVTTGITTVTFISAIDRIPLGTAVAIEFLGPLSVAVFRAHDHRLMVWPLVAFVGVLLLTEPWRGSIDPLGVALAAIAACGWAAYILLTQHVGDRFAGLQGLSITIPVAALTAAVVGVPQAWGHISWGVLLAACGLAVLMPVLPFSLELLALRRLTASAFGTLMALEPALGLVMGLLVLSQVPSPLQVLGVVLVVVAGAGAERRGQRPPTPPGVAPLLVE